MPAHHHKTQSAELIHQPPLIHLGRSTPRPSQAVEILMCSLGRQGIAKGRNDMHRKAWRVVPANRPAPPCPPEAQRAFAVVALALCSRLPVVQQACQLSGQNPAA